MMSYKISVLACWFAVAMITLATGFSLEDVQHRSQRLDGSGFSTDRVKNFFQCTNLCVRRSLCKSVNYNTITRECTSNYHDLQTSITPLTTDATGVVFAEKRSMSQNGGVCYNRPCADKEVCVQLGSDRKCLTEDLVVCGVPDVPNGWFQFGSNSLGSKASIECDEYFRFFGSSRTAECEVTGLWKGINGNCSQVEWRNQETNFTAAVPAPITEGWEMIWEGTPNNNIRHFALDFMDLEERHYMMMDARFNWFDYNNTVVFADKIGVPWNQLDTLPTPFKEQEPFRICIKLETDVLKIFVNGTVFYTFPLQASPADINLVVVSENVKTDLLKFIY